MLPSISELKELDTSESEDRMSRMPSSETPSEVSDFMDSRRLGDLPAQLFAEVCQTKDVFNLDVSSEVTMYRRWLCPEAEAISKVPLPKQKAPVAATPASLVPPAKSQAVSRPVAPQFGIHPIRTVAPALGRSYGYLVLLKAIFILGLTSKYFGEYFVFFLGFLSKSKAAPAMRHTRSTGWHTSNDQWRCCCLRSDNPCSSSRCCCLRNRSLCCSSSCCYLRSDSLNSRFCCLRSLCCSSRSSCSMCSNHVFRRHQHQCSEHYQELRWQRQGPHSIYGAIVSWASVQCDAWQVDTMNILQ